MPSVHPAKQRHGKDHRDVRDRSKDGGKDADTLSDAFLLKLIRALTGERGSILDKKV